MRYPQQIAIAGAGIIGLSCAISLRRRGVAVIVLEAGTAMKEASWAAGGMLAVQDPENPPELLTLSSYSRRLYEGFLDEIRCLSGKSIPLRTSQTLQLLSDSSCYPAGNFLPPLSAHEAEQLVPGISTTNRTYALLEEASLDPRDLCAAAPAAARSAGVDVREQERVLFVAPTGDRICVTTTRGSHEADAFLNCCGAWTSSLENEFMQGSPLESRSGSTSDMAAGIVPRKGQMLVVEQTGGARLTRVVRSADVYLIPRGDGRIAIGATVEDAGYAKQVDSLSLQSLRRLAASLWPPILDAPIVESWAGLRPATTDGLPVIGRRGPEAASQFVAAGHYRNGILLAPGTAEVVADLICNKTPAIDLAAFAPDRSSLSTACDKHFAAAL